MGACVPVFGQHSVGGSFRWSPVWVSVRVDTVYTMMSSSPENLVLARITLGLRFSCEGLGKNKILVEI